MLPSEKDGAKPGKRSAPLKNGARVRASLHSQDLSSRLSGRFSGRFLAVFFGVLFSGLSFLFRGLLLSRGFGFFHVFFRGLRFLFWRFLGSRFVMFFMMCGFGRRRFLQQALQPVQLM